MRREASARNHIPPTGFKLMNIVKRTKKKIIQWIGERISAIMPEIKNSESKHTSICRRHDICMPTQIHKGTKKAKPIDSIIDNRVVELNMEKTMNMLICYCDLSSHHFAYNFSRALSATRTHSLSAYQGQITRTATANTRHASTLLLCGTLGKKTLRWN